MTTEREPVPERRYEIESLLHELDYCKPRYEGGAPNPTNGESTAFSGWYVPDWLMKRIRDALGDAPTQHPGHELTKDQVNS